MIPTWHGAVQPSWSLCVGQPQLVLLLVLAILVGASSSPGGREVLPDGGLSLLDGLCAWLALTYLQSQ